MHPFGYIKGAALHTRIRIAALNNLPPADQAEDTDSASFEEGWLAYSPDSVGPRMYQH